MKKLYVVLSVICGISLLFVAIRAVVDIRASFATITSLEEDMKLAIMTEAEKERVYGPIFDGMRLDIALTLIELIACCFVECCIVFLMWLVIKKEYIFLSKEERRELKTAKRKKKIAKLNFKNTERILHTMIY